MWKLIKILLAGIAVSFYFFPFEFTFLPEVNTRMAMAGVGLGLYLVRQILRFHESDIELESIKNKYAYKIFF